MTTYHQALQRESDKRWDFTSSTGSTKAHPIGYCAGWREPPAAEEAAELNKKLGEGFSERLTSDIEEKRQHQAKYHSDGHATPEEADACYRLYELDNELEFKVLPNEKADTLHRCAADGCDKFTAGCAFLGQYRHFYLCDDHRTRGDVEKLLAKKRTAE